MLAQQKEEQDIKWKFQPGRLIPVQELRQLQLGPVITAVIPAKLTHSLISSLGNSLPLDDAKHLKRVRKIQDAPNNQLDIIITGPTLTNKILQTSVQPQQTHHCNGTYKHAENITTTQHTLIQPAELNTELAAPGPLLKEEPIRFNVTATTETSPLADNMAMKDGICISITALQNLIPEDVVQLIQKHSLQLKLASVPLLPPQTRAQYEEWGKKYWPMTWKVPDGGEVLSDEPVYASDGDQQYFEKQLRALLATARMKGTDHGGCQHASACNAARIVDPRTGQVIGEGIDDRCSHPLRHAAMIAIQAAADRDLQLWPPANDGEGEDRMDALQQNCCFPSDAGDHDTACMNGNKRQKMMQNTSNCDDGILLHGVTHTEGLQTNQGCVGTDSQDVQLHGGTISALPPKPYMCTGYDCFLLKEPCVMCAMGLVHSRVARVIFCISDAFGGALGGKFMLMKQRSLNHHYQVYIMPMAVSKCD